MYNNNFYQPYGASSPYMRQPQYTQYQQPINGVISVNGIAGANQYQLPPSSRVPLFDQEKDVFYLVTTDDAGYPTITSYEYHEVKQEQEQKQSYVTAEQFSLLNGRLDKIEELLANAKFNNEETTAEQPQQQRSKQARSGS